MPYLHADETAFSVRFGGTIRRSGDYSLLTDTTVAAANTVTGLLAAVDAAVVHADVKPATIPVDRSILYGSYSQEITDALVAPLTTVAGLVALTAAGSTNSRDMVPS